MKLKNMVKPERRDQKYAWFLKVIGKIYDQYMSLE